MICTVLALAVCGGEERAAKRGKKSLVPSGGGAPAMQQKRVRVNTCTSLGITRIAFRILKTDQIILFSLFSILYSLCSTAIMDRRGLCFPQLVEVVGFPPSATPVYRPSPAWFLCPCWLLLLLQVHDMSILDS
jgi:hypothetical protein